MERLKGLIAANPSVGEIMLPSQLAWSRFDLPKALNVESVTDGMRSQALTAIALFHTLGFAMRSPESVQSLSRISSGCVDRAIIVDRHDSGEEVGADTVSSALRHAEVWFGSWHCGS